MILNDQSDLAIRSLILLAVLPVEKVVTCAEVAELMQCSHRNLLVIWQNLADAGILQRIDSDKMTLATDPHKLTLYEIVQATQSELICCSQHIEKGPGAVCAFHWAIWDIRKSISDALNRWKLADLSTIPCRHESWTADHECKMAFLTKISDL